MEPAIVFNDQRKLVASSPFRIDWPQLVERFASSPARRRMADAFVSWIHAADRLVLVEFVWIGGSFVTEAKAPRDLDCVLFYRYRTAILNPILRDAFLRQNAPVLMKDGIKQAFGIDAALIPLGLPPEQLIQMSAYWAMVFSNSANARRRAFYTVPAPSILAAAPTLAIAPAPASQLATGQRRGAS